MHHDFIATGTSAIDPTSNVQFGKPYGGVGILCILLVNVYMPVNNPENLPEFINVLGKIETLSADDDVTNTIVAGDFNADPTSVFGSELDRFCCDFNYVVKDQEVLENDSYTFISYLTHTTYWLDHCMVSSAISNDITDVKIDYTSIKSDHLPLYFGVEVSTMVMQNILQTAKKNNRV